MNSQRVSDFVVLLVRRLRLCVNISQLLMMQAVTFFSEISHIVQRKDHLVCGWPSAVLSHANIQSDDVKFKTLLTSIK